MSTVRQVALEEDLMGVVAMAGQPLPNRPDGTVVVVAYSSTEDYGCMATDAEFGRLSEKYPDCVFLVCHKEYVGAEMTMSSRGVTSLPSFEVFSRGSRVAVVTGPRLDEVETKIKQFGFSLSKTDLFSDKSAFSLNSYDQQFPEGPGRGGVDSASEENASSNPWDDAADKVKAEAPHPPLPPPALVSPRHLTRGCAACEQAARAGRRSSSNGALSTPRTTMRYFPGAGMGQDAAENVRKKGSTLDDFQDRTCPPAPSPQRRNAPAPPVR
jgi:hypothetical protein